MTLWGRRRELWIRVTGRGRRGLSEHHPLDRWTPVDEPVDDHMAPDLGRWPIIHNPQPLLLSLSEFNSLKSKGPCVKFRCERDTLVEALTTAGRAVTTRGVDGRRPVGGPDRGGREPAHRGGTDLDLTVRVESEAIGLDDGTVVTPARLAADIVRSLEPGAVTFEGGETRSRSRRPGRGSWCAPSPSRTSPFCPSPGPTR
jgi:hypothetical protein